MIKYYNLYRRIGVLDGKNAHEATMDWMDSEPKVWTLDQVSNHLLSLSPQGFMNELIQIFRESTLDYENLVKCFNLDKSIGHSSGKLHISKNKININIEPDKKTNNIQIKKLVVESSGNDFRILKSMVFRVDQWYQLEVEKTYDSILNKSQLILKHIKTEDKL